jgi:predicted nuclease of predicted toxin-antitoxin system
MRLLFDQNISFRITKKLIDLFPDCKHVSDCGLMDSTDSEIWDYASRHGYTIVTFDADFYDISVINGHPPKIIWIRSGNLTTNNIVQLLMRHNDSIKDFLTSNDFKDISCLEID